jgi:predicted enzyme related to lactoylglutathione lyase
VHKSRLAGFIIDCRTNDLDGAARFWSQALGYSLKKSVNAEDSAYRLFDTPSDDMHIEVQKVEHPSRVHLDIEADDIEAEAPRKVGSEARRAGSYVVGHGGAHGPALLRGARAAVGFFRERQYVG